MGKKSRFKVYVNQGELKEKLSNLNLEFVENLSNPKDLLAVIIQFVDQDGRRDHSDVFNILERIRSTETPAIVLERKLVPEHSKQVWLMRNTVRYLSLDEAGTAWHEVEEYLEARMRLKEEADSLGSDSLLKVGWSVRISAKDFKEYNMVSLFVGRMGDFMVELKALLDNIRPHRLEKNPLREADLQRMLEFEWARRTGIQQHLYKGRAYTKDEMSEDLKTSGARSFFDRKPPSLTRNHIIIEGETGTGKSIIADFIHSYVYAPLGPEAGPLKRVPCANIGEKIMETELFGSIAGTYTDAVTRPGAIMEAYNGTVFLDEIGELTPELQAKLLAYLDTQTIEPRGWTGEPIYVPCLVVAATNRCLKEEVEKEKGAFRRDLYHRLGYTVTIPSLRERVGDLERLVDFVLQNPQINPPSGRGGTRAVTHMEKDVIKVLEGYGWPGNFRQLEQVLRQAVLKAKCRGVKVITSQIVSECLPQQ